MNSPHRGIILVQTLVQLPGAVAADGVGVMVPAVWPIRGEHCGHVTPLHQSQLTWPGQLGGEADEEVEECPGAHNHVVNIHVEPHQQHPVTKALGAETI